MLDLDSVLDQVKYKWMMRNQFKAKGIFTNSLLGLNKKELWLK